MDQKKFTDANDEPEWFKEFMASDSSEINIPPVSNDPPKEEQPFFDGELDKIMQEILSKEFPQEESPEEILTQESLPEETAEEEYAEAEAEPEVPADEEPEEEAEPAGPVRKVRPKKKEGYGMFGIPHILSTVIWLVLAVTIGVSLGRFLWRCATDVLAFGREDQVVYVTITDSDSMDSVTQKLYNAGLIDYPDLFKLYAKLSNAQESISAGTFKLNRLFDYHALVEGMSATSSYRESVEVLIPEGYSCAQIFKLLEEKGVCSAKELEEYSINSQFADYWFLEGVERGHKYTLEGFLFPDTYNFYTDSTPRQVFIKFLDRFDDQLDDNVEEYIASFNQRLSDRMKKHGYTQDEIDAAQMDLYDVITIASMIEKESAHTGENYDVSSVIFNRLSNQKKYPVLQIDATIVYALGGKSDLTAEDLQLDSPYNTYKYSGLPPTPIANPGKSSILAALSPAETDFHYYVLDPSTNEHHFSTTLKEHEEFIASLGK